MRKLLIGVGVVVGLVIGLGFAAPLLVDLNDQKPRIVAQIEEATGYKVNLGGDIRFQLLPAPAIAVETVTVEGATPGAPALATVDSINLELGLLPLLGGTIEIADIRLSRPVITVVEAAAAPVPPAPGGTAAAPAASGSSSSAIAIQRVAIEEGVVEWRPLDGEPVRVEGIEANLSAPSLEGPFTASGGASFRGTPIVLNLNVGRLAAGTPTGIDARIGLAGATGKISGTVSLDKNGPSLAGKVTFEVEDAAAMAALTGVSLPLAGPISAAGTLAATDRLVTIDDLAVAVGESRGTGRFVLNLAPSLSGSLKLRLPRLDADALTAAFAPAAPPGTAAPAPAAGTAAAEPSLPILPSDIAFDVDIGIDALQWSGAVIQKVALVASLEGGRLTLSNASAVLPGATDFGLSGAAGPRDGRMRFDGSIDIASDNPRALTDWLKLTPDGLPADRLTRFGLTAKVTSDGSSAAFTGLVLRLDGATAKGSGGWRAGPRPVLNLALDVDRFNLDGYRGTAGAAAPAPVKPPSNPLAQIGTPEAPSPIPDLGFDLALRLGVGTLTLNGGDLRNVAFDGTIAPDALRLTTLSVADYAGLALSASGKLGFSREAAEADLTLKLGAPSPLPLLTLAGITPPANAAQIGQMAIEGHLTGKPSQPTFAGSITLGDTRLALAGSLGDLNAMAFDLTGSLAAPDLVALARQAGLSPPTSGQALGVVDLALVLKGSPAAPVLTATGKLGPADLDLGVAGGDGGYTLNARLNSAGSAGMLTRLGLTGPVSGPLAVEVAASSGRDTLKLATFKAAIGLSNIDVAGTITTGTRTRIDGRLSSTHLDLALFSSGGGSQGGASAPGGGSGGGGGRWSTKPIDLTSLRSLDGALEVSIDKLVSGSTTLTNLAARLDAAGGKVTLSDIKASANPGDVAGTLTLDASGSSLGLVAEVKAAGFDLDGLTGRKGGEPGLSGRGDVALALKGQGRSPFEIVSSLAGQGRVVAVAGKIHGIDLKTLSDGLKTVNQPGDILNRVAKALAAGTTDYRQIATDLVIERGVARLANLTSDIDGGSLGGEGNVDLPAWNTRARLGLKLAEPADLPALGIEISGPPDAPKGEVKSREIESYYLSKFIGSKLPGIGGGGGGGGRDPGKAIVDQIFKGLGGN